MKKKKIGIKNLKYCEWMSEETNCFTATVTVDDDPIGESNNYKPIDELEQWCKDNLPKWTSKYVPEPMDMTLELAVGELVDDSIARGEYAK